MLSHPLRKLCLLLGALALPLAAQTGLATVQGTVQDSTKAVVTRARITLTNTATGVIRTSESSEVGIYHISSVPIGPYTLVAEAPGFKKWSSSFELQAGQTLEISPSMEVGSVDTLVEVTGAAPLVTTVGAQVSDVKDALRIHQLPLNGRFVTSLFDLTPGVEGGGNPRVNGMKVGSAEMLLDGISLVDRFGGGMARVQPGLDTIQEYRVETAGSGAQYSRPSTVTLVTKSGTNELHGSVYETHRNNSGGLRARQRQDGNTAAKLIRNEFGVTVGGPIIKNKTFWLFNYEGYRERQATFAQTSVPTAAIWGGDFSGAIDNNNNRIIMYDPLTTAADGTRTPFPGNIIPSNRITPFAKTMQGVSPTPQGPNANGNPWLEPNFTAYYPNTLDINTQTYKIDHNFSTNDNLSGRYTKSVRANKQFGGRYGYPNVGSTDAGGTGRQDANVHSAFTRWNHVFTPRLINEFQASAHRSANSSGTLADSTNWANNLGLPNPFGVTGWPTICTDSPFFYYGCWDADNRGDQNLTAYQIEDNITWVKGKHTVKAGFKGRQEYNNVRELQQAQGSHSFYGDWTALYDKSAQDFTPFTGSGFASALLGLPTFLSNQYNRGYFYFQQKELGLYVNDSWKVSSRLTLDLGLRWDKWTPYKEKFDRLVNVDLANYADKFQVITPHSTKMEDIQGIPPAVLQSWKNRGLSWVTADSAGFPGALTPADNNNFAPRIGLAYRLSDKWVVRGGYGVYYWTMPLSQILQSSRTNPPLNLRFVNSLSNRNGAEDFYALSRTPSSNDFIGRATVDITGPLGISSRAQAIMAMDVRDWVDNHAQQWTFSIERELMKSTALRLSYLGNHGSNLEQRYRWNDPESEFNYQARTGLIRTSNPDLRRVNPNWDSGCCSAPLGHSGYSNSHSLQAHIERRYSNGLAFQSFYVYTHAMTTNDTGGFSFGSSSINSSTGSSAFAVPENRVILGQPSLSASERLRLGYANSTEVPPHRIRWNALYELPFGRGKKFGSSVSRATNAVIGGWQFAIIGDWRGGQWMGVNASRYLFGDPQLSEDQRLEMDIFGRHQRLWFKGDFAPNSATNVDQAKLYALVPLDRGQRVLRPVGTNFDNRVAQRLADGSVRETSITDMLNWNARNFFRGPGAWNDDVSIFKYFDITEKVKARFTADFFNFFNHPNDLAPDSATGLQDLSRQANQPRILQFSARVQW